MRDIGVSGAAFRELAPGLELVGVQREHRCRECRYARPTRVTRPAASGTARACSSVMRRCASACRCLSFHPGGSSIAGNAMRFPQHHAISAGNNRWRQLAQRPISGCRTPRSVRPTRIRTRRRRSRRFVHGWHAARRRAYVIQDRFYGAARAEIDHFLCRFAVIRQLLNA